MMRAGLVLAAVLAVVSAHNISHVIVLMLENRSFDHFFGFSNLTSRGLTGNETNPFDTNNPSKGSVRVSNNSPYVGPCDPCHGVPCTTEKIFGKAGMTDQKVAKMDGFVEYQLHDPEYCGVMEMFTPDRLPITMALASEFAFFETFFCSVPGPTWPNRLFALTATSMGCTETGTYYNNKDLNPYPQPTLYDSFANAGLTWKNYYNDTPWELFLETLLKPENTKNIQNMDHFFADAAQGTLPNFAWINPRAGVNLTTGQGSNDNHPDHDVRLGERLVKDVYEALRASPNWNETLFIVTYDEHGGFYDHFPTPLSAPAPDNSKSYPDDFSFTRVGIRIPTLLISPWIKKGTVISDPPEAMKPSADSQYELTSIAATLKKMFNFPSFLSKRDAWAATFDNYLTELDAPRTDCPLHLPDAPSALTAEAAKWEGEQPLNELQTNFLRILAALNKVEAPAFTRQGEIGQWLVEQTEAFLHRNN